MLNRIALTLCLWAGVSTLPAASPEGGDKGERVKVEIDRALQVLTERAYRERWGYAGWMDPWSLSHAAEEIAGDLDERGISELAELVKVDLARGGGVEFTPERRLALLVLVHAGDGRSVNVLGGQLIRERREGFRGRLDLTVLLAVSHLPKETARELLEAKLDEFPTGFSREELFVFVDLAVVLGDADTLAKLRSLQRRIEEFHHHSLPPELNRPIGALEARLELPDEAHDRRARNECLLWQAVHQNSIRYQDIDSRFSIIADRLVRHELVIDADFLLNTIEASSNSSYHVGAHMPLAILARQEPERLREYARFSHPLADKAWHTLNHTGTKSVLRFVESLVSPDADEEDNRGISQWLTKRGNDETLQMLQQAAADKRFSSSERATFRYDAEILRERLEHSKPRLLP